QPRYAFWLEGKDWGVENFGVEPDIEVEHAPGQLFAEDDPQLDRAIAEVFARLEASPAAQPPQFPPPRVQSLKSQEPPTEGRNTCTGLRFTSARVPTSRRRAARSPRSLR